MLEKNITAINAAESLSPEEILERLQPLRSYADPAATIPELGLRHKGGSLLAALTNDDSDAIQNILLTDNPDGIAAGMAAMKKAFDLQNIICIFRDPDNGKALTELAGAIGLSPEIVITDIVDTRAYNDAVMLTFEELAAIADILTGKTPGTLLKIGSGEITEFPFGTLPEELSDPSAKAFLCGHRFLPSPMGPLSPDTWYGSGRITAVRNDQCLIRCSLEEIKRQRTRSCGKCTFCREGLFQLESILTDITLGKAKASDPALLTELCRAMNGLNNCSLGNTAALAVSTLINSFSEELNEHLEDHICRSEECSAFVRYCIDPAKCRSSQACAAVCAADCIDVKKGYTSMIDEFDCTKCGACVDACGNGAIIKISGSKQRIEQKAVRVKGLSVDAKSSRKEERTRRSGKRSRSGIQPLSTSPQITQTIHENKIEPAQERGTIMEKLQTDVIVVAGGPAGLAAAVTLGEQGLKSILFEKSSGTGGAANMGMGILGIDTHIQKENFNNITVDYAFNMHMRYTHYQVDGDLVQTYFHKSADTVRWLEGLGVEFAGAYRYFKDSEATWHIVKPDNGIIGPRAAGKMARILTEKAREGGCEIRLETPATDLIVEDGRVCGVYARDKDGNDIEARAKAVIVATGGFGNNKKMIYEKFGLTLNEDYFPFQIPGLEGDGLNMMWRAGAVEYGTNIEVIYQLPDNANWSVLDGVLRQPNLLINQLGERFMNEGEMGNTTFTGNALRLQPGHYGYCIMDDGILRYYKKNGPDVISLAHSPEMVNEFDDQAEKAVKQGYSAYFEAETLPELAEQLGIDPDVLQDTVDEYNEMCECGVDSKFHKEQRYMHPITGKGKYYAGKFYLGAYGTLGGVRINKYCEVLDKNFMPIEGLYSAGTDANTIYGDSYNFNLPGNSMGFAVNTGRMAAESASEYVKGN